MGGFAAEPSWIFGCHDTGGYQRIENAGKRGWLVVTVEIGASTTDHSGDDFRTFSNNGHGVIVRLNYGYSGNGTLPPQSLYANFATRCGNYVAATQGADIFIIGNETNLPREWPGNDNGDPGAGEPITVSRYVNCYNQCYTAIKNARSSAQVCPSPSGTWAPPYPAQGIEGFLDYWVNTLNSIGASKIDALPIHAYTHGCNPALVTDTAKMGPPYQNIYYNFRVYQNYMAAVPTSMRTKPVYITECDENVECADGGATPRHTWLNSNNGWVKAIYSEINAWNQVAGNQKIRCVALFRWDDVPEGDWAFGFSNRSGVLQDWAEAMANDYRWDATVNTGTISGVVKDTFSNTISAATVSTSPAGSTAQSASDGSYLLLGVPAGTYSVTAAKTGYTSATNTGVVVTAGFTATSNFSLTGIPPMTPTVTDDGVYQTSTGSVHAAWTSFDDTGIAEYQFAISTTQTEAGIIPGGVWLSAGTSSSGTRTGLTLAANSVCYVLAKAKNGIGLWSAVGASNGIRVALVRVNPADAKRSTDGNYISLSSVQCSRRPSSTVMFVQDSDRTSGIKVTAGTGSIPSLSEGQMCAVTGRLTTNTNIRALTDVEITPGASGTVRPLGLLGRSVGGPGTNNIGLLVKVWGWVKDAPAGGIFHLDDGSLTGYLPVKLYAGATAPSPGSCVSLVGIAEPGGLLLLPGDVAPYY